MQVRLLPVVPALHRVLTRAVLVCLLSLTTWVTAGSAQQMPDFAGRPQVEALPTPIHRMQTVIIPAGEMLTYSAQLGFAPIIEAQNLDLTSFCRIVQRTRDVGRPIRAEYFGPAPNPLIPATLDTEFHTCRIQFLGVTLQNGWELVELRNIDASDCPEGENVHFTLSRRSQTLTDTTHDIELSAISDAYGNVSGDSGPCAVHIYEAVLRGPIGQPYNGAHRSAL